MNLNARVLLGLLAMSACSAVAAEGNGGDGKEALDRVTAVAAPLPGDTEATRSVFHVESSPPLRHVALQAASPPPSGAGSGSQHAQAQGDPETTVKKGRLAGHPGAIAGIVIGSVLLAGAASHGGGSGGGY